MNAADLFHLARLVAESKCDGWERLEDRLRREGEREAAALDLQPVAEPTKYKWPFDDEGNLLCNRWRMHDYGCNCQVRETAPGDGGQDGSGVDGHAPLEEVGPQRPEAPQTSSGRNSERKPVIESGLPSTTSPAKDRLSVPPIPYLDRLMVKCGWDSNAKQCVWLERDQRRFDVTLEGPCNGILVRGEGRGEGGDGGVEVESTTELKSHSTLENLAAAAPGPSPQSPPPRTTEPICDCAIDPRFPDLHMPECSIASTTEPQADELKPPTFLSFSAACDQFAEYCRMAADFKHEFPGSAYRTRVDRAFDLIKRAYEVVCEADDRELGRAAPSPQPTPEVAELVKRLDGAVKMNKGDPSCRGMVALFSDAKDALERLSRDLLRTQEICIERGDKLIAQNVDLEAVRAERDAKERERSDLEAAIWEYADLLGVKKASEIRHAINSLKAQLADALERLTELHVSTHRGTEDCAGWTECTLCRTMMEKEIFEHAPGCILRSTSIAATLTREGK